MSPITVYAGGKLGRYNFGADHPFGPARHDAFLQEFHRRGLDGKCQLSAPVSTEPDVIERFHTAGYVERVKTLSVSGEGFLDYGDTPAFPGVYEASARVVGTVIRAVEEILQGRARQGFVPIAGLHHARRDSAAGFCVFNDCGVAIETLRQIHGIHRIAYVDIDAHHGDGVFYAFEDDPELFFADLHEDGEYLYPGTGSANETGKGEAKGCKLNIPMPPGSDNAAFFKVWPTVETFVDKAKPEFILLQCGVDSIAGDPLTHMAYSVEAHRHAAYRLSVLADRHCGGRLLALGGGGYSLTNIAAGWCAVLEGMLGQPVQGICRGQVAKSADLEG